MLKFEPGCKSHVFSKLAYLCKPGTSIDRKKNKGWPTSKYGIANSVDWMVHLVDRRVAIPERWGNFALWTLKWAPNFSELLIEYRLFLRISSVSTKLSNGVLIAKYQHPRNNSLIIVIDSKTHQLEINFLNKFCP